MSFKIVSALDGTNVLSLADAKKFIRLDHATSDEDPVITAYINAAVQYCENYCSKLFVNRQVSYSLKNYDDFYFDLNLVVPIADGVKFRATNGANHTIVMTANDDFVVDFQPAMIRFINPPAIGENDLNPVQVLVTAGMPPTSNVIQAVRMLVGHYYEQRNAVVVGSVVSTVPMGVDALLNTDRNIRIQ